MDFEVAAFQAAQESFPNSQLFGCLFHMTKNLRRRLEHEPGAMQEYRENAEFAHLARTVAAVAFVPIPRIEEALEVLEDHLPPELIFLLSWLEDNCWSVY